MGLARRHDRNRWERLAVRDPYFAVLTHDRFSNLGPDAPELAEFYATGVPHVEAVLAFIRSTVAPEFAPRSALDYGCGTGRILKALAQTCDRVHGVDISPTMVAIARDATVDCDRIRVDAVGVGPTPLDASYDFIHSFIVLQHVDERTGRQLIAELLDRLAPGGVAALHLPYASTKPWLWGLRPYAGQIRSMLRQRRWRPFMRMTLYDLNALVARVILPRADAISMQLLDQDGDLSAFVIVRR